MWFYLASFFSKSVASLFVGECNLMQENGQCCLNCKKRENTFKNPLSYSLLPDRLKISAKCSNSLDFKLMPLLEIIALTI